MDLGKIPWPSGEGLCARVPILHLGHRNGDHDQSKSHQSRQRTQGNHIFLLGTGRGLELVRSGWMELRGTTAGPALPVRISPSPLSSWWSCRLFPAHSWTQPEQLSPFLRGKGGPGGHGNAPPKPLQSQGLLFSVSLSKESSWYVSQGKNPRACPVSAS